MKVVIAGGGTGGHLFSGIAVADLLMKGGGHEVAFIGTRDGIEAEVLPKMGIGVSFVPVGKFRRSGALAKVSAMAILPVSGVSALTKLIMVRPDVVLGVGGYASGPVVGAAVVLGIRSAVIEQNSVAGFTNRFLGRFVGRAFLGLPGAERDFPPGVGVFVGNPVREALFRVPPVQEVGGPFTILVFGGSQGARRINELVRDSLPGLKVIRDNVAFIHLTGPHDYPWVKRAYEETGVRGEVWRFRDDMERLYARAHWAVTRSGAMTVSELAAAGRPSLLIPYPFAVDDHQATNARYLARAGAAVMIRQEDLSPPRLVELIREALGDRNRLIEMGRKARAAARPDAAQRVANWVTGTKEKGR